MKTRVNLKYFVNDCSSVIKSFLTFSQEKAFLIFQETKILKKKQKQQQQKPEIGKQKPSKKFFVFQERELSYILGKVYLELESYLELEAYLEPWYM